LHIQINLFLFTHLFLNCGSTLYVGPCGEITFSSKIGRHDRDFHASSMLSDLIGLLLFSEHISFISIHVLAFSKLN